MNSDASSPRDSDPDLAVRNAARALDRAVAVGSAERIVHQLEFRRRSRRRKHTILASVAACALAALITLRMRPLSHVKPVMGNDTTVLVSPLSRELPDGSHVEFKSGAQIETEFGPSIRRIILKAGEAHFAVTKDAARPFVVVARNVEVRAIGTAFSVDLNQLDVAVLVTSGRVAVMVPSEEDSPGSVRTVELVAGEQAVMRPADGPVRVAKLTPGDTASRLDWRVRRFEFSATRLAEAVALFNRYGGTQLTLDPTLNDLRLSGSLRADDLDALLLLLRGEFSIIAESRADGTVALARR